MGSIREDSNDGYISEADLEYTKELLNLHNDCPLAPEKLENKRDMISNYCKEITDEHNIKVGGVIKLVPNLGNKSKCVLIIKTYSYSYAVRDKINKIHGVLTFKQLQWLNPYIDLILIKLKNLVIAI